MTTLTDLPNTSVLDRAAAPRLRAPVAAQPPRSLALMGLAFLAQIVIVWRHSSKLLGLAPDSFLTLHGTTVTIFFILSGFYLTLAHAGVAPREYPRFIFARLARIWPLHIAGLLLALLILPRTHAALATPIGRTSFAANLALVQAWFPSSRIIGIYNPPAWFLSALFFMYLLFPLLRHRLERNWPIKLGASVAIVMALIFFCNTTALSPAWSFSGVSGAYVLYFHPLARLPEFILGMILALVYQRLPSLPRLRPLSAAALEFAALAAIVIAKLITPSVVNAVHHIPAVGAGGGLYLEMIGLEILPFAFLILVLSSQQGPLARLLSLRPVTMLSKLVFSIFVTHMTVLIVLAPHMPASGSDYPWLVYLALWPLFIPLAYLFHVLIEQPTRRWAQSHSVHTASVRKPFPWRGLAIASSVLVCASIAAFCLTAHHP